MKVQDILTDKSKWTKGWNAKTRKGNETDIEKRSAVCFCLYGAIWRAKHLDDEYNVNRALEKVRWKIGNDIFSWNDDKYRTFKQVRALIVELDI